MESSDRRVVALTALSHGQAHLFILAVGGLAIPLQREFGLGNEELGQLSTLGFALFGLGALPAGMLTDRIGARTMILIYLVGSATASLVVSFARTPLEWTLAFGMLGAFGSLYHPSGLSLLTRTARRRGKALGYHGMAGSIALASTPILVATIADGTGDWRWAYRLIAAPALILIPIVFLLPPPAPPPAEAGKKEGRGTTWGILVTLFALLVFLGFTYRGVLLFMPKYLSESVDVSGVASPDSTLGRWLGLDPAEPDDGQGGEGGGEAAHDVQSQGHGPGGAWVQDPHGHGATAGGALAFIALLAGVSGQWIGGSLSHRFRLESLATVLCFLVAGALICMGLFQQAPLLAASILFSFFYFTLQPVGNGLVASHTSPERRSFAFGVAFTLSFGVGAGGAWFTGRISDRYDGLSSGMLANGLVLLVGGLAAIALLVAVRRRDAAGSIDPAGSPRGD